MLTKTIASALMLGAATAAPVWTVSSGSGSGAFRRLETADKTYLDLDFDELVTSVESAKAGRGAGIEFQLPTTDGATGVVCTASPSSVMHPELAAKFPELVSVTGTCSNGAKLALNYRTSDASSVSASFANTDRGTLFVDNVEASKYMIYSYQDATFGEGAEVEHAEMECGATDFNEEIGLNTKTAVAKKSLRRQEESTMKARVFRLALMANKEYSAYHGNTVASVLNAMVTLMTRVNGVYIREMGVFFELIANTDSLICIGDSDPACAALPNNSSIIYENPVFFEAKGLTWDDFDIGHSVSTGSGGLAAYPGLCDEWRAYATTGGPNPVNDPFWIDYVAHELGHQLLGGHSFRDCRDNGNIMEETGVEPGSGSSIMGYAGICPGKDLQPNSDPYLNGVNLVMMRGLVEQRTAEVAGCGRVVDTGLVMPKVSTFSTCKIPVGNAFVLDGTATGPEGADWAFAWDRQDPGYEPYLWRNTSRFRSNNPVDSSARVFPNHYYLRFAEETEDQLEEILPIDDQTMTFRFVARSQYDTAAVTDMLDLGIVGNFDFKDTKVEFTTEVGPLRILAVGEDGVLTPNANNVISWDVAGTDALNDMVAISMALDDMELMDAFYYETHRNENDLTWVSLGSYPNTGSAEVFIQSLSAAADSNILIKVASKDNECSFFDMSGVVVLKAGEVFPAPSASPTASPSASPSVTPTASPTEAPVVPTTAPTGAPEETEAGLSTGAIVGIAVGAMALLGVGAFVAFRKPSEVDDETFESGKIIAGQAEQPVVRRPSV